MPKRYGSLLAALALSIQLSLLIALTLLQSGNPLPGEAGRTLLRPLEQPLPNMADLPHVRTAPEAVTVGVGETISVDLQVEGVVDLYGAELEVLFDPALLEVVDADPSVEGVQFTPGDLLSGPNSLVFVNSADNVTGTINYAVVLVNPAEPVTGSGAIARVGLRTRALGDSLLLYTRTSLTDRNGAEMPKMVSDGLVAIVAETPTPTPSGTATPTPTDTATSTPPETPSPTPTPSSTPSATATATPTQAPTDTPTSTPTETATATATATSSPTSTATPTATATSIPTATATPSAVNILGQVVLRRASAAPHSTWVTDLTLWVLDPGTENVRGSYAVQTDSGGAFSQGVDLPLGSYDLRLRSQRSLSNRVNSVSLSTGNNVVGFGVLVEADFDGNNRVEELDYQALAQGFGLRDGQQGFDPTWDINLDGVIDISDLSILSLHYGETGDRLVQ